MNSDRSIAGTGSYLRIKLVCFLFCGVFFSFSFSGIGGVFTVLSD